MNYYTGIGSRTIPNDFEELIKRIVHHLNSKGYVLRSGGASGSDTFFEKYATKKEIYLPWKNFNNNSSDLYDISKSALEIAKKYHPNFNNLSNAVKKIMARNCYQVLGYDLQTPSKFVICYTKGGKEIGGTSQVIRIAKDKNIFVFNLGIKENIINLHKYLKDL